jgi:hypothetical protein
MTSVNKKIKCQWNAISSMALLRDYKIWPDNIEDGKIVLEVSNDEIDYFGAANDALKLIQRKNLQNSFDKKYKRPLKYEA